MTPSTEAGRRLLGWLRVGTAGGLYPPVGTAEPAIAAIEAEARAAVLADLAKQVEGLYQQAADDMGAASDETVCLGSAAVLRLISEIGGTND